MSLRHLLTIALALAVLGSGAVCAAPKKSSPDDALLAAHDAFRAGDLFKLQKHAVQLEGHLLAPYLDYWRMPRPRRSMLSCRVTATAILPNACAASG